MKEKSLQIILASSIILGVVFVIAILFSALTIQRGIARIERISSVVTAQTNLSLLNTAFDKHLDNISYWDNIIVRSRQFSVLKNSALYAASSVDDPEMIVQLKELNFFLDQLEKFEHDKKIPEGQWNIELKVHARHFDKIYNRVVNRLQEINSQIDNENIKVAQYGRIIAVFIVIFGVIVSVFLSIAVYTALTQTVSKNYVNVVMQTIGHMLLVFNYNGEIIVSNNKAREILGYSEEDMEKKRIKDIFDSSLLGCLRGSSGYFEFETTCLSAKGDSIPVLISGKKSEAINGFVISAQDLTASKSLQNRLIQSEKMASLGTIAAGVAHEINNPVSFVHSNLSTMRSYVASIKSMLASYRTLEVILTENTDPITAGALDQIRKTRKQEAIDYVMGDIERAIIDSFDGTGRIKDIVKGLRSFSHADDTSFEMANLNQIVESTLKLIWNELKYKCEVITELTPIPSIPCYQRQLGQVFMNLFINASHAIEKHGILRIRSEIKDNNIVISISDTGKGIAPEHLNKIFDPFFTTKAVGTGTGLGLSISYGIIKKHGGNIEVESELGKGTTFILTFPMEIKMDEKDRVLLCVDDELQILNSLKRSLRQSPFVLLTASSAKEGLALIEQYPVKVIISDYRMPEMNGLEFAKIIKEKYPHIIFAIMSGYTDPVGMSEASEVIGKCHYIFKPWENEKLQKDILHFFELAGGKLKV